MTEPAVKVCPEIGCDVARFGDDDTTIIARVGPVAVHCERHNGWSIDKTAGRLKQLCEELGKRFDWLAEQIPVKIDDDGVGGGVLDLRGHYRFVGINAGSLPTRPADYPNRRSELWFGTVARARAGLVALGRLNKADRDRLGAELLAPRWTIDAAGRRVVEKKDETKKTLRRSPDLADALNLAYADFSASTIGFFEPPVPDRRERKGHGFGR